MKNFASFNHFLKGRYELIGARKHIKPDHYKLYMITAKKYDTIYFLNKTFTTFFLKTFIFKLQYSFLKLTMDDKHLIFKQMLKLSNDCLAYNSTKVILKYWKYFPLNEKCGIITIWTNVKTFFGVIMSIICHINFSTNRTLQNLANNFY